MMSKQIANDQNRGMESIMDDQEGRGETYFAASAKLNDSAMVEYGLKKGNAMARKVSMDLRGRADHGQDNNEYEDIDDEEFWERFDSRGKKMKLRRVKVFRPPMSNIAESFATINFNPNTYITQKDLKLRATSIVYGHYKDLKRKAAVHEQ